MGELEKTFLKLLTAAPFQKTPRRKVTVPKLVRALSKMLKTEIDQAEFVAIFLQSKAKGNANTTPKILLPDEIETAEFQIWITPLGRQLLQG